MIASKDFTNKKTGTKYAKGDKIFDLDRSQKKELFRKGMIEKQLSDYPDFKKNDKKKEG